MTEALAKYGEHAPVIRGALCEVCGTAPFAPVADHCHEHGWVRGTLCRGCNGRMALIDRRTLPPSGDVAALVTFAGRCPECPGITVEDLTAVLTGAKALPSAPGQASANLRIPDDLHARVVAAAASSRRSMNGEILWLIEQALDEEPAKVTPFLPAVNDGASLALSR